MIINYPSLIVLTEKEDCVKQQSYPVNNAEDKTAIKSPKGEIDPKSRGNPDNDEVKIRGKTTTEKEEKYLKQRKSSKNKVLVVASDTSTPTCPNIRVIETNQSFSNSKTLQCAIADVSKLFKDVQIYMLGTRVLIQSANLLEAKVVETMIRNRMPELPSTRAPSRPRDRIRVLDKAVDQTEERQHTSDHTALSLPLPNLPIYATEENASDVSRAPDNKPRRTRQKSTDINMDKSLSEFQFDRNKSGM